MRLITTQTEYIWRRLKEWDVQTLRQAFRKGQTVEVQLLAALQEYWDALEEDLLRN
jgi:hypothetical protein